VEWLGEFPLYQPFRMDHRSGIVVGLRSDSPVQFAVLDDGIIVIRVHGRGTHLQAPCLNHIHNLYKNSALPVQFIFDLENCSMMDSTFMGTLASMGIHQRESSGSQLVVTNMREHVRELLDTLGLKHIVDMRDACGTGDGLSIQKIPFTPVESPELSRRSRVLMMLEAHQKLIDIDTDNEVKFKNVMKQLQDNLDDNFKV
jgi:anti-sigma B factor antagonist